MKVSYSCLPSAKSIITSHNKKILSPPADYIAKKCNCRNEGNCPLNGNCLVSNVIYNCNIKHNNDVESINYIGLTENTFKDRFYKHRNSFKYSSKANCTELSKYIWESKNNNNIDFDITWSILDRAKPYANGSKRCNLCTSEKYHVITTTSNIINKRSELVSKCRHENKFYLCNFKDIPPD